MKKGLLFILILTLCFKVFGQNVGFIKGYKRPFDFGSIPKDVKEVVVMARPVFEDRNEFLKTMQNHNAALLALNGQLDTLNRELKLMTLTQKALTEEYETLVETQSIRIMDLEADISVKNTTIQILESKNNVNKWLARAGVGTAVIVVILNMLL